MAAVVEQAEDRRGEDIAPHIGIILRNHFEQVARDRRLAEDEWLDDLRQYEGVYTEERIKQIPDDGSRAYIRLTRTKVKSTDSRMMDMLFPGGTDKNWRLESTPQPELPKKVTQGLALSLAIAKAEALAGQLQQLPPEEIDQLHAQGRLPDLDAAFAELQQGRIPNQFAPDDEELRKAIKGEATDRAKRMETEIDDQLTEGDYVENIRKVLHSGNLYGSGWFKGPMVESRTVSVWRNNPETDEWELKRRQVDKPYFEFVPIWDVYPESLDVSEVNEQDCIYQRYLPTAAQLRKIARQPLFDREAIYAYMREHPHGDAPSYRYHETQLKALNPDDQNTLTNSRRRRYEVIQRVGYLDAQHLIECGCEGIGEDAVDMEFKADLWLLGDQVIKAVLHAYDDESIDLYHLYRFERRDTGLHGEGIARIMRDPDGIFNAAIRAALDNLGMSTKPQAEYNQDLMDPEETPDMFPGKVWIRRGKGPEAQYPGVKFFNVPSNIEKYIRVAMLGREFAEEATALPSYAHGQDTSGGASETAHGLSMLLGQSNIVLKDPVRNFDEGVTTPFIRGMNHWNMQFSAREDIKGDHQVQATGSSSLVAREIYGQKLEQFAAGTLNPADDQWIKRGELNRERAKAQDLDAEKLVYTDEEFADNQQRRAEQQAAQQGAARPAQTP